MVRGALQRALGHLASADRTGGLFLKWEEFGGLRERRRFIYHALSCERLALGKVSAEHRTIRGVIESLTTKEGAGERTAPLAREIEGLLESEPDHLASEQDLSELRPELRHAMGLSDRA